MLLEEILSFLIKFVVISAFTIAFLLILPTLSAIVLDIVVCGYLALYRLYEIGGGCIQKPSKAVHPKSS